MVNRLLLWAAGSSRLEHAVANNRLLVKTVHRFVAGAQLSDAVSAAVDLNTGGIGAILDLLGEGVEDLAGASEAAGQYREAVEVIAERGIDSTVSLKLSQLGLTVDGAACAANLAMILERAKELGVGVEVDMEQSDLVDRTLDVFREAIGRYPQTRLAIQACLRRTPSDLDSLAPLKPRIRLVKGAYAEPIERALRSKKDITAQFHYLTDWAVRARQPARLRHTRRRLYRARGAGGGTGGRRQTRLRDPDAVRHPKGPAAEAGRRGVPGPRLHPVRFGLVPLPDAADGRTTREHAVLPAFPDR